MRKGLMAIFIILLLVLAGIYFLIPDRININQQVSITVKRNGLFRLLSEEKNWVKWWPQENMDDTNGIKKYGYEGNTYEISEKGVNSLSVAVKNKNSSVNKTTLIVSPQRQEQVAVEWVANIQTTNNPLKRVEQYFFARQLEKDMKVILEKMKNFYSDPENIYELNIQEVAVVDSILVSTFSIAAGYPSTTYIYNLIERLKQYIKSQAAEETGFPMLNVNTADSIKYLTRVAIPVNKKLNGTGDITYKRMLGGGNILVTEVKGGPSVINKALFQLEKYVNDYERTSPAIPFQSLVTDRNTQTDTTNWITRIYYPVY